MTCLSFLLAITFILPALYRYASASILSQQELEASQQELEAYQQQQACKVKDDIDPAVQAYLTRPQVPLPPLESEDKDIKEVTKESEDEEEASEAEVEGKQRERGYGYESEDEDKNENDDEDEDNNDNDNNENNNGMKAQSGGKHCKKEPTRKIVKKAAWCSGYMQKQMFILDTCHTIGKLVPRAVSLFTPMDDIMWAGACHFNKAIKLGIEITDHPYSTLNEKLFDILVKFLEQDIAIFEALNCFPNTQIGMQMMIKDLCLGFKESRRSDTNKVQTDILMLLIKDPLNDSLTLPKPAHKTVQGFHHINTGHLLCPQIHLQCFNENECFIFNLTNSRVKVMASEWPSFVYNQDLYNPLDAKTGLMVTPQNRMGQNVGVSQRSMVFVVTGHMIAYAACQTHYALSSKDGWCKQDRAFNMTAFYGSIVTLFEDQPDDIWVLQTLAWWNEQVFGDENGHVDVDRTQDDLPPTSTIARMTAHHEA
ncbi:hypothetical protein EDD18DRAFT_1354450 [Armillaria luteobubalina]|uniref:Uncharacterized protein n=1 Tax=Armillaria luteobubalina TaxID=153913 RepID=A0AA39Q327_9AGAR|nr:hypothetical protein EDD18DRAFT_1354450 [Armillaria luteobubalina]